MLSNAFIGWLSVLPFIFLPKGFEQAKVIWFLAGSLILCLSWIFMTFKSFFKDSRPFTFTVNLSFLNSDYLYFFWLFVLFISGAFSTYFFESLIGTSYRRQGIIFFLGLWLVGFTIRSLKPTKKRLLIKLMFLGAVIQSLILFFDIYGTFGNANAASGFVVLTILLTKDVVSKSQAIFLYVAILPSILYSSATTSILVYIFSILKTKLFILVILIMALTAIIAGGNFEFNDPYEGRRIIWDVSLKVIKENPIIGYGAESGEWVLREGFRKYATRLEGLIIDRSHNIFMDVTIWSGIIGLMLFLGWLYLRLNESKFASLKPVLGWMLFAFFQPLGIVHFLLLFIILETKTT